MVGFEDEAATIIMYLTEQTQQLDVISIVGMRGLGKTTVARKVFYDPAIEYKFPTRIWVYVSQMFTEKDVFLTLLREFSTSLDDMQSQSDEKLAQLVTANLERRKFLIVMDDVWTTMDWDRIKIALPTSNKMGKVLITSRHLEVALFAGRHHHRLRFLTQNESWLLLQMEIFGDVGACPPELEVLGRSLANVCYRLPLAIVIIGGILVKKFSASSEMNAIINAWEEVSESLTACSNKSTYVENIISLSYNELPNHLRVCFLYLGMFPEDFEIPVWKLIRMWIAEGFIRQKSDEMSSEETAERYLDDLIKRNLVIASKIKLDGKVNKTCRLHDMVRDFCKTEAGNQRENIFQEIEKTNEGFYPPLSNVQEYRRLCIHSKDLISFLSSNPYGPRVRSFVCFSKEEITLLPENILAIPAAFKLLRVLDVQPARFPRIPILLYQLVHLKYLTLSCNLAILPEAFSKLWNIQTLIVDTTSPTLDIKADIWEMIQLRHLKTNASATLPLPKTGKSHRKGEQLQTLGIVSPESFTEEVSERARNLKILAIRGQLASLLEGKNGSSDSLAKLCNLEKLKLLNDVLLAGVPEGQLRGLPQSHKFPPNLRWLTLSHTFLEWHHMSTLGLLENLEILKLKHKAFMGMSWKTSDGGFRRLQVMHIGLTDLAFWEASGHHFPSLIRLELHNCEQLQEVPFGLVDIPSLKLLDLYHSTSAAASSRRIEQEKWKQENLTDTRCGFRLSIFPPAE